MLFISLKCLNNESSEAAHFDFFVFLALINLQYSSGLVNLRFLISLIFLLYCVIFSIDFYTLFAGCWLIINNNFTCDKMLLWGQTSSRRRALLSFFSNSMNKLAIYILVLCRLFMITSIIHACHILKVVSKLIKIINRMDTLNRKKKIIGGPRYSIFLKVIELQLQYNKLILACDT